MPTTITNGCVLHWEGFEFDDGERANKYVVVLSCKPSSNWLIVVATSKQKRKEFAFGCHEKDGYYHIPGGGKDFFPVDTWLLLMECREVDHVLANTHLSTGTLRVKGQLRVDMANAIRNCLRRSLDASPYHVSLL